MVMFSFTRIFTFPTTINLWESEEITRKIPRITRLTITTTAKTITVENNTGYDDKIYVMAAYMTSTSMIRLTMIRKCKAVIRLRLHLKTNQSRFLTIPLIHKPILKCPWFFAVKCDFVGYFAVTMRRKDLNNLLTGNEKELPEAYISRMDKPSLQMPIVLNDVRVLPNSPRKHYLAVCLQPIFFLADWTLLVQFFEIWIAQGVTKFCVYVQSMTPEVDALLHVYEHSSEVEIERINWAPLPTGSNTDDESNPNFRIYRTEVATSINDCVLRCRGHAKYVISSDLDEIVVAYKNASLIKLLDSLQARFTKSAAFVIRSSFALFENHWANISRPTDIDFSGFANISLENYIWPAGLRSKVVMIPENIYSTHVHQVLQPEIGKVVTIVPPETALVFHLRRVMRDKLWSSNTSIKTNALARFIDPCNKSWKNRLKVIKQFPEAKILYGNEWPQRGSQVMQELEACREQLNSIQNSTCHSPYRCMSKITSVTTNEWVIAQQTWTVL
uniref:Glycosyltransferase family 92 protein n=1 Tax=Setaria digitata TaxID=48799 RepID=A0A915PJD8_9BILA